MALPSLSSSLPLLHTHPKLTNSVTLTSLTSIRSPYTTMRIRNHAVTSVDSYAVGEDLPVDYADWLPVADSGAKRRAGVLLHPTSFPGPYGIGDLGDQAFRFIDWLHDAGCSLWQV